MNKREKALTTATRICLQGKQIPDPAFLFGHITPILNWVFEEDNDEDGDYRLAIVESIVQAMPSIRTKGLLAYAEAAYRIERPLPEEILEPQSAIPSEPTTVTRKTKASKKKASRKT